MRFVTTGLARSVSTAGKGRVAVDVNKTPQLVRPVSMTLGDHFSGRADIERLVSAE